MLWALLIIVVSVVLGTLLALVPKGHASWMGPMRTFALTAALSVVVLHLLPEALTTVGAAAIVIFLLGLFTPELLGKLGAFLWRAGREGESGGNARDLALEASYFGLLLHRVGDGIGLGAFTGETYALSASGGVLTALAAHAVPVVAIVVLTFDSVHGRGAALARAAGLAAASMVGVFLAHSVPAELVSAASGWVSAFVGGTLLHVVTHDLSLQLPQTVKQKSADLLAGALGLVVSLIGRGAHNEHGHEGEHAMGHFEHALTDFAIETGPLLILGLVVGAVLTTWGAKIPASFFRSRGAVIDAARGTLIGAPLPLCSCSVLPISSALKMRGAAPALIVSFLIATPELGVETFALSVRFLGWEFALIRLVTALLVAFGAALVVAAVLKRRGQTDATVDEGLTLPRSEGPWHRRVLVAFDELFHHVGAWMILGIVAAALVDVALPPETFAQISGWPAQFLVVTLVAVPSYVCAPSATPLAAVLLAKGLSPGAVLVGLLLGPATNIATLIFLGRWFGRFAAFAGVFAVVALAWIFGFVVDHFWTFQLPTDALAHEHEHGTLWMIMAVLSGLLLLRAFFRAGVRGFLSTLQGEHGHAHGSEGSEGAPGGHGHGDHAHGDHAHGDHAHGDHAHDAQAHGAHAHGHGDHAHGGHGHSRE